MTLQERLREKLLRALDETFEPQPVAHEHSPVLVDLDDEHQQVTSMRSFSGTTPMHGPSLPVENIALTLGLDRWPVLVPFITAMVRKLDANKPKKGGREGWCTDLPADLMRRVLEEAAEMRVLVDLGPSETTETRANAKAEILDEAADVANMAMMVADASGALDVPQAFIVRGDPPVTAPLSDEDVRAIRFDYQKRVLAALEEWNERPSDTRSPAQVVKAVPL